MFWLFAEAAVNPKYVAEYVFPGVITGFLPHTWNTSSSHSKLYVVHTESRGGEDATLG
jgi:hypothetical protein